jgi:hypothetical protein
MTAKAPQTIPGADIKPGQVVKIGGRWYRVIAWHDAEWQGQSGYRMAQVISPDKDPRLASLPGYLKFKLVWRDDEHKIREQPAPVWDWVARMLEQA